MNQLFIIGPGLIEAVSVEECEATRDYNCGMPRPEAKKPHKKARKSALS